LFHYFKINKKINKKRAEYRYENVKNTVDVNLRVLEFLIQGVYLNESNLFLDMKNNN